MLSSLGDDAALDRVIDCPGPGGTRRSFAVRDILLHVINHGIHHRAQAVNMLRHLAVAPPRVDYIFMKLAQRDSPPLSVGIIRDYYRYSDWAQARVLGLAESVGDEQLDRPFEMGLGTLRRTLVHLMDAEAWWLGNWTDGPNATFPQPDVTASVQSIQRRFADVAGRRNEMLSSMVDADLQRVITAQPVAGTFRSFPIGQTMLQLCCHGTHHRAQAVNMLRQLGVPPPRMDYTVMKREQAPRAEHLREM
jgi:uncharacterized damage-inducible protein DinB